MGKLVGLVECLLPNRSCQGQEDAVSGGLRSPRSLGSYWAAFTPQTPRAVASAILMHSVTSAEHALMADASVMHRGLAATAHSSICCPREWAAAIPPFLRPHIYLQTARSRG